MSLGRKAAVGAGWVIAWRGFARLVGFANTLVLARLLLPTDFGLVAMAMTFEVAIQQISAFPVYEALLRQPQADTDLHDTAFTIQLGRTIVTAAILALLAPLAAQWFGDPRLTVLAIALAMTGIANGLNNIGIVEFQRDMRFDVQFTLELVPMLLNIAVTLTVAWLTHSYWALLAGIAARRMSRAVMSYVIHPYRPRLSLQHWRSLTGFSLWLWLSTLAGMTWNDFDPFALGRVFGSAGLGLYTVASQLARLPATELIDPLSSVLVAGFAYAQRDRQSNQPNPFHVMFALLLVVTPIALVVSARASDLVAVLLGAEWSAATPLVTLAAWGCLLYPMNSVGTAALVARGQVRKRFYLVAIMAALRVALVILAVLTGSLIVVIVATIVALAMLAGGYAVSLAPEMSKAGVGGGLLRVVGAAVITAGVLQALGLGWSRTIGLLPQHDGRVLLAFLHLAGSGLVAAAVYGAAILAFWLLSGRPRGGESMVLGTLEQVLPASGLRTISSRLLASNR